MRLQAVINPKQDADRQLRIDDGYDVRPRDKVVHTTKNNYEIGVMNGEQGRVTLVGDRPFQCPPGVMTRKEPRDDCPKCEGVGRLKSGVPCISCPLANILLVVDYGDRKIGYSSKDVNQLQLAYALTVHRAQGSEAAAVVAPIHSVNGFMLKRPLLYTLVTRPSKYLLLIGQRSAFEQAVRDARSQVRRTRLGRISLWTNSPLDSSP